MADTLLKGTTLIEDKRGEFGKVWSCSGVAFAGKYFDSAYFTSISTTTGVATTQTAVGDNVVWANVSLPDGAEVTGAVVYGSSSNENWSLIKTTLSSGIANATMATAAVNTEDTSITNEKIDNTTYCYFFVVLSLDEDDEIYGARIKYN